MAMILKKGKKKVKAIPVQEEIEEEDTEDLDDGDDDDDDDPEDLDDGDDGEEELPPVEPVKPKNRAVPQEESTEGEEVASSELDPLNRTELEDIIEGHIIRLSQLLPLLRRTK